MLVLPPELRAILIPIFTYLVTQGLKSLANLLGKDFGGWVSGFVAAVVLAIMVFIDGIVGLVPAEYYDLANTIFALIVALLSSFGIHYTRKNG